jgi:chemotaxis protein MotB
MAAPPPPSDGDDDDADAWLVTYADAVTLLMAFFVMLVSFSKIDIPLFEQVAAGIKDDLGKRIVKEEEKPIQTLKVEIQEVVFAMQADQVATVETDDEGIVIELDSSAFFQPGSADIRPEAYPVLQNMAATILAPKYETYFIEVEGHTDDDPISTARYPSNWELSAGRSSSVVRAFIENGGLGEKMKAIGYAETQPKYPNREIDGTPIPENQAANRRVAIHVRRMTPEERNAYLDRQAMKSEAAGDFSMGRPGENGEEADGEPPAATQ